VKDPVTDPVPDPVPDPVTEPVIRLRGLNRRFSIGGEEVLALKEIDLQICRGEFVAIMGASGSGKSTLMNLMGCLDQPSEGTYLFEGRDVSTLSEPDLAQVRSDRIGFVFQSFNLLPRTSALENVILPLLYGRSATLSARERAETGRRALYVNTGFTDHIVGLSRKESDWLLSHLYAQASVPEFQCRFVWRPNSIAFWDNRSSQHYAVSDYFPQVRRMERVTIVGDRPFFDPSR